MTSTSADPTPADMDLLWDRMNKVYDEWCDETVTADTTPHPTDSQAKNPVDSEAARREIIRDQVRAQLVRDIKMITHVRTLLTPNMPGYCKGLFIADQKLAELAEQIERVEGKNQAGAK